MEVQFYGANCIKITTKKATVICDDNLAALGLKTIAKPSDVLLRTSAEMPEHPATFTAELPGEYEIAGVVIEGIAARGFRDADDTKNNVIYKITADDITVAIIGHVFEKLSDDELEKLGVIDIMLVPVGGNGYTMDGLGALKLVKDVEPKIVIPTHFEDKAIKYQVPQQPLTEALKVLAMEPSETLDKFKPKAIDLSETTKLIVLNRQ